MDGNEGHNEWRLLQKHVMRIISNIYFFYYSKVNLEMIPANITFY